VDTDGVLRLHDLTTGQKQETAVEAKTVRCLAISPDGRCVAAAHDDKSVHLWEPAGEKAGGILRGHPAAVVALAFSPDGKTLAAATEMNQGMRGCRVKLWDVPKRADRSTISYAGQIACLAFSPDGKTLAAGTFMLPKDPPGVGGVRLWEVADGKEKRTISGARAITTAVAFSPDGKRLVMGHDDGVVDVADLAGGPGFTFPLKHSSTVHCVAFSPDGDSVASGSREKTARLWDVAGREERAAVSESSPVRVVAFARPGTKWVLGADRPALEPRTGIALLTVSGKAVVRLWDAKTGEELNGEK
jgi:WD40 repeat protein